MECHLPPTVCLHVVLCKNAVACSTDTGRTVGPHETFALLQNKDQHACFSEGGGGKADEKPKFTM